MDVNFVLPGSITRGTPFQVDVTVKRAVIGATIMVTLTQEVGVAPAWAAPPQSPIATAAPGSLDGTAVTSFIITLAGPVRAFLKAEARDSVNGGFGVAVDHTEVT